MVSPTRFLIFSVCKFIIPYLKAKFKTFYPFMRELVKRTLSKVDALTEEEYAELAIYAAEEV